MANGERFNVIARRTAAMRRLPDAARRAAIAATPNVVGFQRFAACAVQVRIREADAAARIQHPEVTA